MRIIRIITQLMRIIELIKQELQDIRPLAIRVGLVLLPRTMRVTRNQRAQYSYYTRPLPSGRRRGQSAVRAVDSRDQTLEPASESDRSDAPASGGRQATGVLRGASMPVVPIWCRFGGRLGPVSADCIGPESRGQTSSRSVAHARPGLAGAAGSRRRAKSQICDQSLIIPRMTPRMIKLRSLSSANQPLIIPNYSLFFNYYHYSFNYSSKISA